MQKQDLVKDADLRSGVSRAPLYWESASLQLGRQGGALIPSADWRYYFTSEEQASEGAFSQRLHERKA